MAVTRKKKTSTAHRTAPASAEGKTPASAGARRAEPATTTAPIGGTMPVAEASSKKKKTTPRDSASSKSTSSRKSSVKASKSSSEPAKSSPAVVVETAADRVSGPSVELASAKVQAPQVEVAKVEIVPTATDSASSGEALRRMISDAAYFRAEHRGFVPGHDLEDWLHAECLVLSRLKTH